MTRICFVCLGNICRSPTAEGIFVHLLEDAGFSGDYVVESAGTAGWHEGNPPDPRSREEAARRGVDLVSRSQPFRGEDFDRFDLVLAMDRENERDLLRMSRSEKDRAKVRLLRSFDGSRDPDVPDPYFGEAGFPRVFDICDRACRALLRHLGDGTP